MATTTLSARVAQQLNNLAATDYEQNSFLDQGDQDHSEDSNQVSTHKPPSIALVAPKVNGGLVTLYLSPTLSTKTPLYTLRLYNSPSPTIPPRPVIRDRAVAAEALRNAREGDFPDDDPNDEHRMANNAKFCQGESTDNVMQASVREDGTVRTFWEVDYGLQAKETIVFEVIWHQWVSLELLERKVPFGFVQVGREKDLDKKVLHFIGRSNLTELIRVAGDKACILITFGGPTGGNKSSLLVVPRNFVIDQDIKGGIIRYAKKWTYVKPIHVRQLESSAKLFPSPLDSALRLQARHQLVPMKAGVPMSGFDPSIASILAEAVPKGGMRTTSLGLPNLVDLKQTHLGALSNILDSPTSAILRKGNTFSAAAKFVDEKGEAQTIVTLHRVLRQSESIQDEIGLAKNELFGGAVEMKRVLWTGEKGSENGKGTGYFRVSAAGARDYPKDICYAMSKTLLSLSGEGGAIVSVVYSVHAPIGSDSKNTHPLVDILSSFTYGRDFEKSDYSPILIEASRSLLGSRARMEPSPIVELDKPLVQMKSSFAAGGLSPIDLSDLLRIYETFNFFLSQQSLLSFIYIDSHARKTALEAVQSLTGLGKISKYNGNLFIDHAYSLVPETDHDRIRREGSNEATVARIGTGVREDVQSRKRKSDEGVDAENTVTTKKWAEEDDLWAN